MELLRVFKRVGVPLEFEVDWKTLHPKADALLEQALAFSRAGKTKDQEFMEINKEVLTLILPEAELEQAMKEKDWSKLPPAINVLVGSGQIGMRLFSAGLEALLAFQLHELIQKRVSELLRTVGKVTQKTLRVHQAETQKQVSAFAHLDILPQKRKVKVTYRTTRLTLKVQSPPHQVQLTYAAGVKSAGTKSSQLPKLVCEDMLVQGNDDKIVATFEDNIFVGAKAARARIAQTIDDKNATTGDVIHDVVNKSQEDLYILDPDFAIELAVVDELLGAGSGSRMQTKILECLPSAQKHFLPLVASQNLNTLQLSPAGKMADRSSQSRLTSTMSMVNSLAEDRNPDVREAQASDFMRPVVDRFQYFIKPQRASGKAAGTQYITGAAVLTLLFEGAKEKCEAGKFPKESLTTLTTFTFLLTQEQHDARKELTTIMDSKTDISVKVAKSQKTKATSAGAGSSKDADRATQESIHMFS